MQTEIQPVATTKEELLFAAIRAASFAEAALTLATDELLGLIESGKIKDGDADYLHEILMERHRGASALPLFIAASNLKIELPEDLRESDEDPEGED